MRPKAQTKAKIQPQPEIVATPKVMPDNVVTMTGTAPLQDRIRERAYELYEARGRGRGQDEQDWLRAEQEILNQRS